MEDKTATEANVQPIAAEEKVVVSPEDAEARIAALQAEKAAILEREANYKNAYLKEVKKNESLDETEDEKMERVAKKVLADSRLAEIAREQEAIIQKALKENKELKLVQMNKNTPPASIGTHNESTPVADTLVTPDQMAHFKAKGWTDKDIERYKKNLQRSTGR